jgi:hypothetical protein
MTHANLSSASSLGLAVAHLNASVGSILTVDQLAKALEAGTTKVLFDAPTAAALVSYLFVEVEPKLVVQCTQEVGTDVLHANMLYCESLRQDLPRVPQWESAIMYLI